MKISDVLKKERTGRGLSRVGALSIEDMAKRMGVAPKEYEALEGGDPLLEKWFPLLCEIAVETDTPTAMLLSKTGRSDGYVAGQCGTLIRDAREERGRTVEEMAEALESNIAEYVSIEKNQSLIEKYGIAMLRFAEAIDQPIFNLYLPCGVLYSELDDYP
jgi:transcriptional regulator with XRE-family HTH domain